MQALGELLEKKQPWQLVSSGCRGKTGKISPYLWKEIQNFIEGVGKSVQKEAIAQGPKNFVSAEAAQHIVDRWHDAVSPGSPPSASDDLVDLLSSQLK